MPTNDALNTALIEAARNGDLEQILELVPSHPFKDWDFAQALYWAVSYNRVGSVEYLLAQDRREWDMCPEKWVGITFDQARWYERMVSNASDLQHLECLNLLVDALYRMRNPPARFFQSAFTDACIDGKYDSVKCLLDVVDPTGTTFIHKGLVCAAGAGHIGIVRLLGPRVASPHWVENYSTYSPSLAFVRAKTVQDVNSQLNNKQKFVLISNELQSYANPHLVLKLVDKEIAMGTDFKYTDGENTPHDDLKEWANNEIVREKLSNACSQISTSVHTKGDRKL